jgi:hypothetical protein
MKPEWLTFRLRKGSPLRKPTPVWVGWMRWQGHKRGLYLRLGEHCFGVLVR